MNKSFIKIPFQVAFNYWEEIIDDQDLEVNCFFAREDYLDVEFPITIYYIVNNDISNFGDAFKDWDFLKNKEVD